MNTQLSITMVEKIPIYNIWFIFDNIIGMLLRYDKQYK